MHSPLPWERVSPNGHVCSDTKLVDAEMIQAASASFLFLTVSQWMWEHPAAVCITEKSFMPECDTAWEQSLYVDKNQHKEIKYKLGQK